jgi:hypothetical protein
MEYEILISESDAGLARKVRKYIEQGWIPLGGVASDTLYLYQAMSRQQNKP